MATTKAPMRIISLLPSAAEILCLIGAGPLMVGRSHEDDFPQSIQKLPIVTASKTHFTSSKDVDVQVRNMLSEGKALYSLDTDLVRKLNPNVVVTQDLCDVCSIDLISVERLIKTFPEPRPRIVTLNPKTLDQVMDTILQVGQALGMSERASQVHRDLKTRIENVAGRTASMQQAPLNSFYVEWLDPIFCGGHWTPKIIEIAGGRQVLHDSKAVENGSGISYVVDYPDIENAVLETASKQLDFTIVSPCGLDIPTTLNEIDHLDGDGLARWKSLMQLSKRVIIIDGNQYMNRSGPRLIDALEFLEALFHNRELPADFPYHVLK